jgi:regulator of sirC expression with transglutaminase-like and TPR domain
MRALDDVEFSGDAQHLHKPGESWSDAMAKGRCSMEQTLASILQDTP